MTGPVEGGREWLFISDIDDTLTGDDAALKHLSEVLAGNRERLWFVVNSSRPSGSVADTLINVFPAGLTPDAVVTAMGTEISVGGENLTVWQDRFDGWPQARIFEILQDLGHTPHDAIYQTSWKVSFAVPVEARAEAVAALEGENLNCQIIASGTSDFDVLPATAGKGEATRFLAAHLGIAADHVVASGDSGNDVELLKAAEHRIAVGNARQELLDALPPVPFYHARAKHAAGVLEGLMHFGVVPAGGDQNGPVNG